MTIRKLYQEQAGASGHLVFVGTPGEAADVMQDWFESRGCDGWNLIPAYMPGPALECLEWLVPELQRRGQFQTEYEGDRTLRGSLGLARPAFHSRGAHARGKRHVYRRIPPMKASPCLLLSLPLLASLVLSAQAQQPGADPALTQRADAALMKMVPPDVPLRSATVLMVSASPLRTTSTLPG